MVPSDFDDRLRRRAGAGGRAGGSFLTVAYLDVNNSTIREIKFQMPHKTIVILPIRFFNIYSITAVAG